MGRACRQLSAVIPIDKSANDRFGFNTAADLFDKLISLTSKNLSIDFRKTQDDMPGLLNKKIFGDSLHRFESSARHYFSVPASIMPSDTSYLIKTVFSLSNE